MHPCRTTEIGAFRAHAKERVMKPVRVIVRRFAISLIAVPLANCGAGTYGPTGGATYVPNGGAYPYYYYAPTSQQLSLPEREAAFESNELLGHAAEHVTMHGFEHAVEENLEQRRAASSAETRAGARAGAFAATEEGAIGGSTAATAAARTGNLARGAIAGEAALGESEIALGRAGIAAGAEIAEGVALADLIAAGLIAYGIYELCCAPQSTSKTEASAK
jgi:hypothetical protein